MDDNRVIELPSFNINSLKQMLLFNAQNYYDSYRCEVEKMTEIVDPNNTIKTEEESKQ